MARLRWLWQKIKQHTFIAAGIIVAIFIAFTIAAYKFGWDWTGFSSGESQTVIISTSKGATTAEVVQPAKALWDWLNLLGVLAIPAVVGLGAAWFTAQQGKVSGREKTDNQRETALQAYIDKMSELLIEKHLRESTESKEVQKIARVRTLTVLRRLDAERKGSVLQFLEESGLIDKDKPIIDLWGADLSGADLRQVSLFRSNLHSANLNQANLYRGLLVDAVLNGADLRGANLRGASLKGADLSGAKLSGADLSEVKERLETNTGALNYLSFADLDMAVLSAADLVGANLRGASLRGADLRNAMLRGANLRRAQLLEANLAAADLRGADLSGADLRGVWLGGAKLSGANLRGADLSEVKERLINWFSGTDLDMPVPSGTNLVGADLSGADLDGANLQGAIYNTKSIKERYSVPLEPTQWPQGFDPEARGLSCLDCLNNHP